MKFNWLRGLRTRVADCRRRGESAMAVPHTPDQEHRLAQAQRALQTSQELLEAIESREGPVKSHARNMRTLKEQNGFGALILSALRDG